MKPVYVNKGKNGEKMYLSSRNKKKTEKMCWPYSQYANKQENYVSNEYAKWKRLMILQILILLDLEK
jgi:hypothetical protein